MRIKPNPDMKTKDGQQIKVFDPVKKKFLPAEGANVPDTAYWLRRLAAGEVIKVAAESVDTTGNSGTDDTTGGESTNKAEGEPTLDNQSPALEEPAEGVNVPDTAEQTPEQEENPDVITEPVATLTDPADSEEPTPDTTPTAAEPKTRKKGSK